MWHSVLSFVVTFPASVLITAATIRVARRKGWLVHPRPDRWSRTAVAKFGGVSILLTFFTCCHRISHTQTLADGCASDHRDGARGTRR